MFFLDAIKVTTKLGRVSEASFCPTATESHQGQRGRKGKISGLGISILGPISRLLCGLRLVPLLPISGSRFPKDNPQSRL